MVDHALAAHFGGVRGQHRHHQRLVEHFGDLLARNALLLQRSERVGEGHVLLRHHPLAVFREVGEHREQTEPAHEGERIVEIELVEPQVDRSFITVAFHAGGADFLGPLKQLVAAMFADHIAQ